MSDLDRDLAHARAMPNAENDAATEYRVMWFSEEHGKWFPHTPQATTNTAIADAWAKQAQFRGDRRGPVPVRMEQRTVTPWTRVTSPGGDHES